MAVNPSSLLFSSQSRALGLLEKVQREKGLPLLAKDDITAPSQSKYFSGGYQHWLLLMVFH